MQVYLIDGTFELFRAYYGAPSVSTPSGKEIGAVVGLLRSLIALLRQSKVTHLACAFDHVLESFRNRLFPSYKSGVDIPDDLLNQFNQAEEAVRALGIVTWPMVEYEADDALATAALRFSSLTAVDQVVICSPDKDLSQIVKGNLIVTLDRIRRINRNENDVLKRFGVPPASIPDFLALVGDVADGIPGIPRWGTRSAATVLSYYRFIEAIPEDPRTWKVQPRGATQLAQNLNAERGQALFYKSLTTLKTDVPITESLEDLLWQGAPRARFETFRATLGLNEETVQPSDWL